jgi:hypothetical protein
MWVRALFIACVLPWPFASAAPWVRESGDLYARASVSNGTVEGLQGWRGDAFLEYGVTDTWTATFKAEHVQYPDAGDFDSDAWRATLRGKLIQVGSFTSSVELGALQGAAIGGRNGCDTLGFEARVGGAWAGQWSDRQTFAFVEAAGRYYESCERQRLDLGLGQNVSKDIWSITQFWRERGGPNARSDKIQSELLWRRPSADLSIGYSYETGGAFTEQNLFLAIARAF